ncbi:MAG: TrmH family RNA methyltransferase [Psychrobacter sp.]|nr:TrmH family RNA methyltransferase [Psychrobacter sp.]
MSLDSYLSCVQVVMVNTTLPANIGSAARAMHTMGLSRLTVVDPKLPIDDSSISCAAGGISVLDQAQVVDTLPKALESCQLVFAASSRSRHLPRPVITPEEAALIMIGFIDQQRAVATRSDATSLMAKPSIAILFGREDRGLTNEELALADFHIQIPANPEYPVLNVAAAVQVIASFIYAKICTHVSTSSPSSMQGLSDSGLSFNPSLNPSLSPSFKLSAQDKANGVLASTDPVVEHQLLVTLRQAWDEPAATHAQTQHLTERLTELMISLGLADAKQLRALPQRLSRLTSRLQLDQKEYQLLSAVVAKLLQSQERLATSATQAKSNKKPPTP